MHNITTCEFGGREPLCAEFSLFTPEPGEAVLTMSIVSDDVVIPILHVQTGNMSNWQKYRADIQPLQQYYQIVFQITLQPMSLMGFDDFVLNPGPCGTGNAFNTYL